MAKKNASPADDATLLSADEFDALAQLWDAALSNDQKVELLASAFKRVVWYFVKMRFVGVDFSTTYSAAKALLRKDPELQDHAATFWRLHLSLAYGKKNKPVISSADVDESVKTLCSLVSFLFAVEPPPSLRLRCEAVSYRKTKPAPSVEEPVSAESSFRLEVTSVDADAYTLKGILVESPELREVSVTYVDDEVSFFSPFYDLHKFLSPGVLICVVTPLKIEENHYKASEIVLEPDFLLSPQGLAASSEYGYSHFHYLLKLIFANQFDKIPSFYRLKGNFANACLADSCTAAPSSCKVVRETFEEAEGLSLAAESASAELKKEFNLVYNNVKKEIRTAIPEHYKVEPEQWQIEAPLFSNVYGISAQADALSRSYEKPGAVVFELKSGKWETFRRHGAKSEHLFQAAFYADMLFFMSPKNWKRASVSTLLFYCGTSKEGFSSGKLFSVDSGRTQIQMSVAMRNRVVSILKLAKAGSKGKIRAFFDSATPEKLRNPNWSDRLWYDYKYNAIEGMLSTVKNASKLEREYFFRQLQFVAAEDFQSRLGYVDNETPSHCIADSWRLPLAERIQRGLCLADLKLLSFQNDKKGRICELTFDTTQNERNVNSSIRKGDGVCFYKVAKRDANLLNSILFNATVWELTASRIVLHLDNPQSSDVLSHSSEDRFRIESSPVSYGGRSYAALGWFLTGCTRRRNLILNLTPPAFDASVSLPLAYAGNEKTRALLTAAWQAKDWFLIWGPPGTGKTSHAMRDLVAQAMASPKTKILLLAYTYKATCQICEMLEARKTADGSIENDYLLFGREEKFDEFCRPRLLKKRLSAGLTDVAELVERTQIFVAPIFQMRPDDPIFDLLERHIDLAIVDEASQLLDIHLLPLFCARRDENSDEPLIGKFILIGDHKQLPAVVQQSPQESRVDEPLLRERGITDCRMSLFERFYHTARANDSEEGNPHFVGLLDAQYRMHPTIGDFCNILFYGDRLRVGGAAHQQAQLSAKLVHVNAFQRYVLSTRLGFIPVAADGEVEFSGAKVSRGEAAVCARIVEALCLGFIEENGSIKAAYQAKEIAIIVPFRSQIAMVRKCLSELFDEELIGSILIDTVERLQGDQRKVIIFTTVIQSPTQAAMISAKRLTEPVEPDEIDRKFNVAITRARERFYLVGNEPTLRALRAYSDLLIWIENNSELGIRNWELA